MMICGWSVPDGCSHFVPAILRSNGRPDALTIETAIGHARGRYCALDIGAHIGTWTRSLAASFEFVHAFEPNPAMYEHFRLNTAGCSNVWHHPIAVGARRGTCGLQAFGGNSGQRRVAEDGRDTVVVAIDDLALIRVDLIKIDVEGYELRVLEGAAQTIDRDRPVVVIEENVCSDVFGIQRQAAAQWLRNRGAHEVFRCEFVPDNFDVVFVWRES